MNLLEILVLQSGWQPTGLVLPLMVLCVLALLFAFSRRMALVVAVCVGLIWSLYFVAIDVLRSSVSTMQASEQGVASATRWPNGDLSKIVVYYTLNIELVVNGETIHASTVQALSRSQSLLAVPSLGIGGGNSFWGEALVVEMPDGKPDLVVAMSIPVGPAEDLFQGSPFIYADGISRYDRLFLQACEFYTRQGDDRKPGFALGAAEDTSEWYSWIDSFEGRCDVPSYYTPLFLVVADREDPSTLEAVEMDELSETYGMQVEVEALYVETTDRATSDNIKEIYPWLDGMHSSHNSGGISFDTDILNSTLITNSFFREE